jgi:predicted Abi (CAAX) family protease
VGGIIACGFVASLRWQLIAQQTAREEVHLRATLDQIKTENKYLKMEQVGALSPQRLEAQLAAGAGLAPMKLDDPSAVKILESQIRTEERQQREAQIREAHLRVLEREKASSVKSIEKKEKVETTNPSGSLVQ